MQQTQTAVQQRKRNLQDYLLSKLRRSRMGATVFLVNGFQIRGEIRGFDSFVVVIYSDGKQQMVYKHAISTIVPLRPISLQEEAGDNEQRDCRKSENTTPTVKYQKLRQDAETALSAP